MMDTQNAASTCTFYCEECWAPYGGVPGKAVGYPWPKGRPPCGPKTSLLKEVDVTDYGWPDDSMVAPYGSLSYKLTTTLTLALGDRGRGDTVMVTIEL